jgi:hypothetical protein
MVGGTLDNQTQSKRLFHSKNAMSLSSKLGNERSLSSLRDLSIHYLGVVGEPVDFRGNRLDVERVLCILISNFDIEQVNRVDTGDRDLAVSRDCLRASVSVINNKEGTSEVV